MKSTRKGIATAVLKKPAHGLDELGVKDKHKLVNRIWAQDEKKWEVRQGQRPGNEGKATVNHLEVRIQRKRTKKEDWMRRQRPAPELSEAGG